MPQTDIVTAYRAKLLRIQRKISHGMATDRRKKMPKTKKDQLSNGRFLSLFRFWAWQTAQSHLSRALS